MILVQNAFNGAVSVIQTIELTKANFSATDAASSFSSSSPTFTLNTKSDPLSLVL